MQVVFVTNRKTKVNLPTINELEAKKQLKRFFKSSKVFGLDYETTSLDPLKGRILLTAMGNGNIVYVIDNMSIPLTNLITSSDLIDKLVIAQSAKFEYKWSKVNGLNIQNIYCTMIAEQKLLSGSGVSNDLVSICQRRKVPVPTGMDKNIRKDFYEQGINLILEDKHIIYNACDVIPLFEIRKKQQILIEQANLSYYINNLQCRLIPILGDTELLGFVIDQKKWMNIYNLNLDKRKGIESALNSFINTELGSAVAQSLSPTYVKEETKLFNRLSRLDARLDRYDLQIKDLKTNNKDHTKKYKDLRQMWNNCFYERYNTTNDIKALSVIPPSINWNSTQQLVKVFEELGLAIPQGKSNTTGKMGNSFSGPARERWLSENKGVDPELYEFMQKVDEYKNITHNIDTFGEKWLDNYIHPITSRAHTFFKQGTTDTGRLASGDRENGFFNSQQIPAIVAYRECFGTEKGYRIVTCDLEGAELRFMCSLAQDMDLLELSKEDMHSHMANEVWNNIHKYRRENYKDLTIKDSKGKEYTLPLHIAKNENPQLRTDFKPQTFGTVYGMYPRKASETLGISLEEGKIAINTIKKEIPLTIKMVESKVKEAMGTGKVIHNNRTNSRRWFPTVLDALDKDRELSFKEKSKIQGQARNCAIQGSQADCILEAIVTIDRFIKIYKIDAALMGTVHDELIYRYREDLTWFPEFVKTAMIRVANKYLTNVKMDAEYKDKLTWTK